ncbi:amidohydrolase (plasmid) [Kovacikia minuta CCNUW1]|uniref:amidohydrolase n=1 Tax=Kovacikia minuta TaxID=2931930 RepID=UPI001CCE89AA|nr:amidohydrolase [Kovacikia minuta]UBF30275.1 amidohydrolase [Kovacikia minuta CCNUW1]
MMFFRNLFRKQWLKRVVALTLGAIATSLLLWGTLPFFGSHPAQAQKLFTGTPAAKPAYWDRLLAEIDQDSDRIITIFKDIHQNPELQFNETRTAAIVAKELTALGYEVKTGIGKTGVVGILRNGDGSTLMYRADMDGLPVQEMTGLPYASTKRATLPDGTETFVMHACGHDSHVAWMLGLAKAMVALKSDWKGTLILVGQPAEEGVAGARAMVEDGLYTRHNVPIPDYLLGMHSAPGPTGFIASAPGTRMAGSDPIDVVFKGVGGHGSSPHLAKDPILMAANAIIQYQAIVARAIDPQEAAVITVGSIQAGEANNVIPEEALLKLSLRSFKPEVRETMLRGIKSVNVSIARAYGMPEDQLPTLTTKGGSPPLVNDQKVIDRINPQLVNLVGANKLIADFPGTTGSEDIHLLKGDNKDIQFGFIFVGIAEPALFAKAQAEGKRVPFSNHNPNFQIDLNAIPFGTKVASIVTMELLQK